jgi:restriction endonuclease S subunit
LEEAGHGTKTLPTVNFSQLQIPIPPISEQVSIANFINHLELEIERVLKGVKEQISKLQELKQVLISEAVTGKIKV